MQTKQLVQRDCNTGEYEIISPSTTIDSVIDPVTGESARNLFLKHNHLYLPFKDNSKQLTRLLVLKELRRKGLWITYRSCKGNIITEYYNSDKVSDDEWKKNENWAQLSSELPDDITNMLNKKVDSVEGMGLSSNDFTDRYKEIVESTVTYNNIGDGLKVEDDNIKVESLTLEELNKILV